MKLPALLYGLGAATRRQANKAITRLKRGRTIIEAFDELGGFIEVEQTPGLILLDYNHTPYPSFHLYSVLHRLREHHWDTLLDPLDDALFEALVSTEWGVVMLMCEPARVFFGHHQRTLTKGRYRRFLEAAVEHWPAIEGVGDRWALTLFTTTSVPIDASKNLRWVLQACNLNAKTIRANAHLGLPELLRRYPPEPEKYVPPQHDVQVLRTDEEIRASIREGFVTNYREVVEDFTLTPAMLRKVRLGTDGLARQEGFDPADLDPYWHDRPENKQ